MTLAALATGAFVHALQHTDVASDNLTRFVPENRILARLEGRIATEPRIVEKDHLPFHRWRFRPAKTVFVLDVDRIELGDGYHETQGRVRVTVNEAVLDLQQGDRVRLLGWFYSFSAPHNPGSYNWTAHRRRQGIVAGLSVKQREAVQHIPTSADEQFSWTMRLRDYARRMLTSDLESSATEQAGLLQAMILGQRSALDRRLNDIFVRAGCIHFLAVSGIHVAIVMLLIRMVVQPIPFLFRKRYWIMGLGIIVYVIVAEPRPSILRAATMGLLFCVARLLGRRRGFINAIAAAAVLLLAIDTDSLYDVGFQLSFTAVCGIALLAPSIHHYIHDFVRWCKRRFTGATDDSIAAMEALHPTYHLAWPKRLWMLLGRWFVAGLAVSLSCWLIALPIVALHFQRVPMWGALNSLLVLPIVTLVMGMGFAKMALMVIVPWLVPTVSFLLTTSESLLIYVVDHLSHLPGSIKYVAMPSMLTIVLYYVWLIVLSWVGFTKRKTANRHTYDEPALHIVDTNDANEVTEHKIQSQENISLRAGTGKGNAVIVITTALLLASLLPWSQWMTSTRSLRVTFLSVGAGSTTVIELPDGQTWLYDAGTSSHYNLAQSTLLPYLSSRGIRRIDRIILSHPNLDHYSAIPGLIDTIDCGPIVVNRLFRDLANRSSAGRELLRLLRLRQHPIETGMVKSLEALPVSMHLEQLWPTPHSPDTVSANNSSTVLRLTFAEKSLLLTGDIENVALSDLSRRDDLHATVLVLPHHGDVEPSTRAFLQSVGAEVLIRSSYQRSEDTKNGLLQLVGRQRMFNTAEQGAVTVEIDASGVHITSQLSEK